MTELSVDRNERILTLTLNRSEKRNALSPKLVEELLVSLSTADPVRTDLVIIQGAGSAFSAGFDFSDIETATDADLCYRFARIEILLQTVHHLPVTTLAFAHGPTYGAGADLLCACDLRVADASGEFRLPGLAFGVVLGTRRLATRVGVDRAHRIQSVGGVFDATEALQYGFINQIAARADWPTIASSTTAEIAHIPVASRAVFSRATRTDSRDRDLADLIRAASAPGLADRVRTFRSANR